MRTKYNLKPKQISKPDQNVKLKSKEKNLIWIPKSKPIQTKYQTLIIITKYQTIYFFFFFFFFFTLLQTVGKSGRTVGFDRFL